MKLRFSPSVYIVLAVAVCLFVPALADDKPKDKPQPSKQDQKAAKPLSEKEQQRRQKALQKELNKPFEKWLNEDVTYIITDEERQAFKRLQNAEEREQFIEQFWLRRDPTPDTEENEYKEEHYRRIAYVNEHFPSGIPGWKTDRGRIYITFGPPDEIESHPSGGSYERPAEEGGGETSTFPFEQWRYRYIEGVGQDIIIEFVDPTMSGEYRMTMDPSEKDALLYVPNAGLTMLESMGLADKSDRFNNTDGTHLGQPIGGQTSKMNQFERLEQFAKLQRPPSVKMKDLEEVVISKISYNLFPFQFRTDFIKITTETVLAALTVQVNVKDMSFKNKEGIQQGLVNIFGRVSSITGRVVQTFEDVVQVDVPAEELPKYLDQKRVYWQGIPLRPGMYRINLVLKDIASGNMGTQVFSIRVPRYDDEALSNSTLILADDIQRVDTKNIGKGQFVIGSTKVRPSVGEQFRKDQRLGIYLQVYNLATDEKTHKPSAHIEYALLKDNKQVYQFAENSDQVPGAAQQMTLEKVLPLGSLAPGRYTLQVKVTDNLNKQSITPAASFTVQ
jgi:GWxTD domain-containing protein